MAFTNDTRNGVIAETAILANRFVGTGTAKKSVIPAVDGSTPIIGVTIDDCGDTAGKAVTIQTVGTTGVVASGVIGIGVEVTATTDGKAVAATSGDFVAGITLDEATAENDVIEVQLQGYIKA